MTREKITLSQLESFLSKPPTSCAARWMLRSSRNSSSACCSSSAFPTNSIANASSYGRRTSPTSQIPALLKELLEDKTSYGDTFFVPVRARWHESWTDENGDEVPALKDLKQDIGNMLNKAIAAVEDENDALNGVLKNNINFNAIKGKTKIPDQKWKDLLDHFNQPQFVLVNDNFEFPDLLGAAYEYLIKYLRRQRREKGRRVLHARRSRTAAGATREARRPAMRSTIRPWAPAAFSSRATNTWRNRAKTRTISLSTARIPTAPSGPSAS